MTRTPDGINLTDSPTYTKLTESWAERDVAADAVTEYSINNNDWKWDGTSNSPSRTITVTQPTGVISKQYSYRTPNAWTDGLVFADETIVMNGSTPVIVASSLVSWQQGNQPGNSNYESPRPGWAKVFDENGDEVRTEYTYGTNKFNQITRSCDYDDAGLLLRCANATYENGQDYLGYFDTNGQYLSGRHIFNLVLSTSVEKPDGTRASLTQYEYDNYTSNPLIDAPGVVQHLTSHDPFDTGYHSCNCRLECEEGVSGLTETCPGGGPPTYWVCDLCANFDVSTNKRGNVTKVTSYSDAQNITGAIIETRGYDKTGNLVKSSSACCEQTSILYDDPNTTEIDTQYAYPVSQTRGSADVNSPHRVTTSATYLFETGLVKTTKDANNLVTTNWYNPDTLRPVKTVSSTGAYSETSYDEANMTVTEEVFQIVSSSPVSAGKTKKYLNGLGKVRKEESFAPSGVIDIVESKYTQFAEDWKTSRPYRTGDTVQWSEKFYDLQRRLIKVVEPDGSETKAFYNEAAIPDSVTAQPGNRIRVMDAWGRERWGRYDQQGRLTQVVEPNPDAATNPTGSVASSGSLLTKYSYDTPGRLTQTEQGVQLRKFKYDDLGRLTRQKLAEQTATLNDAGSFVGSGGSGANWSEALFYDGRSNLTLKVDPRGVKTHLSYQISGSDDPLNRIQSRSYDLSGPLESGLTIHAAPSVSFTYMPSGDKSRIQQIRTDGLLTENFSYDGESL